MNNVYTKPRPTSTWINNWKRLIMTGCYMKTKWKNSNISCKTNASYGRLKTMESGMRPFWKLSRQD